MNVKEVTAKMLWNIRAEMNEKERVTDKQLAQKLGITPASFSRLITGKTEPKIMTWYKIYLMHRTYKGLQKTTELLSLMEW